MLGLSCSATRAVEIFIHPRIVCSGDLRQRSRCQNPLVRQDSYTVTDRVQGVQIVRDEKNGNTERVAQGQ